jgi:tRNA (guanine37-N1)-methyltransferase
MFPPSPPAPFRAKSRDMFRASVFTLMPDMFPGPLGLSLSGDGLSRGLWALDVHNIRDHGLGRHRAVDDTPAGGGPGMVIRADVLAASLDAGLAPGDSRPRLLMSPRGRPFTQSYARQLAAGPGIALVCGRFEGVDERVIAGRGLEEVSIGDYVLTNGALAAAVLILDAQVIQRAMALDVPGEV